MYQQKDPWRHRAIPILSNWYKPPFYLWNIFTGLLLYGSHTSYYFLPIQMRKILYCSTWDLKEMNIAGSLKSKCSHVVDQFTSYTCSSFSRITPQCIFQVGFSSAYKDRPGGEWDLSDHQFIQRKKPWGKRLLHMLCSVTWGPRNHLWYRWAKRVYKGSHVLFLQFPMFYIDWQAQIVLYPGMSR